MAALVSSTELCPSTLSCRHRTEKGLGAESRHHGTWAFSAHTLSPGLKWVRGESPKPLIEQIQLVAAAGLASSSSHREPRARGTWT